MTQVVRFVLALLVITAAASDGAVAQEESALGSLFDAAGGVLEALSGFADGLYARLIDDPADRDAAAAAQAVADEYNAHSDAFEQWANERTTASTDATVLRLRFRVDGETVTRYVVADVNGSDYVNSSVVPETSREIDERCTLEGAAARNAADELEAFRERFVATDADVSRQYLSRLAGQYGGAVECSFNLDR